MIVQCAHCSLEFDTDSQSRSNPFVEFYCDDCLKYYKNHRSQAVRNIQEEEDSFFPEDPVPSDFDCHHCNTPMRLSWVLLKRNTRGEPVRAWVCPECNSYFRVKKGKEKQNEHSVIVPNVANNFSK